MLYNGFAHFALRRQNRSVSMALQVPPLDLESPTFNNVRRVMLEHGAAIMDDDGEGIGYISFKFGEGLCHFVGKDLQQAYYPFFYYENDDDTYEMDLENRKPFDAQYLAARRHLVELYGEPCEEGRRTPSHRPPTHYYLYAVWRLKHCRLALAQDEVDIQFGLDLSLRFLYKEGPTERLIHEFGEPVPEE
jgi:hypothetical protein